MEVNLSSLPKPWQSIKWDSDESTVTAYYIAAPTSTSVSSTPGIATVDALFSSTGDYLIQSIGDESFDPPVASHHKSPILIGPEADITIPFTLIDSDEETMTGALRFAPFKVEYRWKFDPPLQFADGKSVIRFSVSIINPPKDFVITDYDIKQDQGWKLDIKRGENSIEGTITSTKPSKGKLSLTSKGTVVNTSKDEVGFGLVDIAIANLGETTPLAEDRQPGGEGSAPTPHETDPGAYLIATTASPNTASSSTVPRAEITLSGNGASFAEGSYELTTSGSEYISFYETKEGGQPIELPKTYSATELASPKKSTPPPSPFRLTPQLKPQPSNSPTNLRFKSEYQQCPIPNDKWVSTLARRATDA